MFNATVAGVSNHSFRSDKLKDTKSDNNAGETSQEQQKEGNYKDWVKKHKTSLYLLTVLFIFILLVLCIIYVAMGGLL